MVCNDSPLCCALEITIVNRNLAVPRLRPIFQNGLRRRYLLVGWRGHRAVARNKMFYNSYSPP